MPKAIVVIRRIKLGGKERLDIRRFRKNKQGELIPTSRGLSLPADKIEEIITLMRQDNLDETEISL